MKFDEVWSKLDALLRAKTEFTTLHDHKPFGAKRAIDAVRIDSDTLKQPRIIKKEEFRKIWLLSKDLPEEKRFHPGNYSKNTLNASYILTLFDAVNIHEMV